MVALGRRNACRCPRKVSANICGPAPPLSELLIEDTHGLVFSKSGPTTGAAWPRAFFKSYRVEL
jgi:hypothetical protein